MHKLLIGITIILVLIPIHSYAEGFLSDRRYRGWFWFEDKKPIAKENIENKAEQAVSDDISSEDARAEIEQFAKELEELKFVMLARPNVENVKAYRDKEKAMWEKAMLLHDSWDMANLLYPEQRDLINNPVNVHAVKVKREFEAEENNKRITEFAKEFDLVLFFSSSCKYCGLLSPVLNSFGKRYGFNIDAISNDGTKHEYFKTANARELIERLGITAFPTVIAISRDSKTAFELIRGYVSISELEQYSLLAIKYLEGESKKDISPIRP